MRKIIFLMLFCSAAALTACSDDKNTGFSGPKYAVGDLYPNAANPSGVVFWVNPSNASKGLVVSFDEAAGKIWSEARDWRSAHALPAGKTWRLPAKDELQYLYCAWMGAAPQTWENTSGFSEDTAAAAKFRGALATSGVGFSQNYYWTSEMVEDGDVWVVGFVSGTTGLLMATSTDCITRNVASF